jgi:hypothetical protein
LEQITAAFRRLAKKCHPDVNPTRADERRFVEAAEAYRILRERLRPRPRHRPWGRCPRCRHYAELFEGLDGGKGCVDCLLGRTQRSRFLPLPAVIVVRHLSVFALYGLCVLFLLLYVDTGQWDFAASSFLCVVGGMLLLTTQVLVLAETSLTPSAARRRTTCH